MKLQKLKQEWNTWFIYFLIYSMIGWIYEVLVCIIEFRIGFVNRGFLWGPYLPVYGFGGLLIILSMRGLKKKKVMIGKISVTPILCFVGIVVLTTAVELLTSYLMEIAIGQWLWDYTEEPVHFQGRIALTTSLRFGVIGICGLYGIQPLLEKILSFFKNKEEKIYNVITYVIFAFFMLDVVARFFLGSNFIQQ